MLTVEEYEVIRRKVRDGMSQREVSRQLGYSRNTVAKALKYANAFNLPFPFSKTEKVLSDLV